MKSTKRHMVRSFSMKDTKDALARFNPALSGDNPRSGCQHPISLSLDDMFLEMSHDHLKEWYPERNDFHRTQGMQCLIIPEKILLTEIVQQRRTFSVDCGCKQCDNEKQNVSTNERKPTLMRSRSLKVKPSSSPRKELESSGDSKMVSRSTTLNSFDLTEKKRSGNVQLSRCLSLYARERHPHNCSHIHHHHTPPKPSSWAFGKTRTRSAEQSKTSTSRKKMDGNLSSSPIDRITTTNGKSSSLNIKSSSAEFEFEHSTDSPRRRFAALNLSYEGVSKQTSTKPSLIPRPISPHVPPAGLRPRSLTYSEPYPCKVRMSPNSSNTINSKRVGSSKKGIDINLPNMETPTSTASSTPTELDSMTSVSLSVSGSLSSSLETIAEINQKHRQAVPDGEDDYPVPIPPGKTKSEIYEAEDYLLVDQHVIQAGDSLLDSFDDLIGFLLENLSSDVAKVRALYRWTISQKLPLTTKPGYRNIQTPLGFLYCIRQKLAYFPELFATLCRKAEIPCVIIHGIAKGVCYDVGDKVTSAKGKNSWNAVYLEGGWRLIHPFWAAHTVNGYQTGRWAVVESDQFHTGELKPCVQATHIPNDFYFLTDPDKFITRCFPEDPTWQLLHTPLSKTEFEELPFLQPAFYELQLTVISHFSCAVPAVNGRVEIKLGIPAGKNYLFGYKLLARRDLESEGEYSMMHLDRYVLHYTHDSAAVFELRFPVVGIFKLELHCKDPNRELPSDWICDYKIICSEIMPECEPLPMVPGNRWGPGTELEAVGLDCLTHKTPIVSLDEQTVTQIRFSSPKDKLIDVEAIMFTNHQSADELWSHVTLEHEADQVIVKVSPPGEGEYALQMFVKDANGDRKNVCNFLCQRTLALEDPELADIRSELIKATEDGDVDELSHWIEKFVARNMEDRGDLYRARKKLLVARLSRDIREALDRKDLDLLEKALQSASDTSLRRQLGDLAGQAEAMRSRLRRLKRLRHEVLAMDHKTISEIKSYSKPPPAVHAVMSATFLLLGNKETELKQWSKVQILISKQGKESLKKRVEVFNMDSVSPAVLNRVHEILSRFDLESIQIASAGAATFYQWAISMAGEDSAVSPTTKL